MEAIFFLSGICWPALAAKMPASFHAFRFTWTPDQRRTPEKRTKPRSSHRAASADAAKRAHLVRNPRCISSTRNQYIVARLSRSTWPAVSNKPIIQILFYMTLDWSHRGHTNTYVIFVSSNTIQYGLQGAPVMLVCITRSDYFLKWFHCLIYQYLYLVWTLGMDLASPSHPTFGNTFTGRRVGSLWVTNTCTGWSH